MGVDLSGNVVLRWDSTSNCAALLEPGGIDAVWLQAPDDALERACRAAGAQAVPPAGIRVLPLEQAGQVKPGDSAAIKAGVWPGAQAASRGGGAVVASATARAWVDANGYLIPYLRALYPGHPAVLAYQPDRDAGIASGKVIPYESLELALVEAWCAGGNYILAPDAPFRDALLAGESRASSAWKQLGRTARWLKQQRDLFRRPPLNTITVLVEPGDASAEIANLLFRHSGSPDLISAARVPPPDPARRPVVVAAGLSKITAERGRALLAHARAGATVVADGCEEQTWWRSPGMKPERRFEDREFYKVASGCLVAYRQPISDPGDFALDVLDLAGARRPVRVFDMSAAVATVTQGASREGATLTVVNYGYQSRSETMVHVNGVFASATLMRPETDPAKLRTWRRGGSTEVMIPGLSRVAVVVFGGRI
jgi:hypothetical protein